MTIVGDPSVLEKDNLLSILFLKSNIDDPYEFIFYLGLIVLATLAIATLISMFITWRLTMFANKVGIEIGDRLYTYYLNQDWLFHTIGNSSNLTKKIANETTRVTIEILVPLMLMNSRIILTFFIIFIMFLHDPFVLMIILLVFSLSYIILFKFIRQRLVINGKNISNMFLERFKLMNEGFGGIKEVLLLGRSNYFKERFNKAGNILSHSLGTNRAMEKTPRYFMEWLGFTIIIVLVLYLLKTSQGNLGIILPVLSAYALAGMKLLPALQQIYHSIAQVKGNISAYETIQEDLKNSNATETSQKVETNQQVWSKHNEINLKNITFNYPDKAIPALENISLTIKPNTTVGFVGTTGSGKSTLIDIILGLIKPQQGEIAIDGTPLTKKNLRMWQNKIGFVPQTIFLTEDTIAENITFGIPQDLIDYVQIKKVLKLAHLEEWVSQLEKGVYTKVGERGVQVSGGQKQRIGIARALYNEADVLVFDEATSALDVITEKNIMNSINKFTGQKTLIIIAHRMKTVEKCNQIFMMENGRVVDRGTYQQLLEKNEQFKKM
jgi:HlyD family secretion protein